MSEIVINGKLCPVNAPPDKSLMDVLRDDLGLTGVKDGCATGHCGSCMIIRDGKAERACLIPMKKVNEGAQILTIEGLANPDGSLHPIQRAYVEQGATQCGFCTPGILMSSKALLNRNPHPSEAEIREALVGNLCRCTGYLRIIEAVQKTAQRQAQEVSK